MKSKKIFMKFLALGLSIGNVLSGNVFISSVKAGRCKSTIKRVYAIKYKNKIIRLDREEKRQSPVSNTTAQGTPNPFNGNAMNIYSLQNQTAPGILNLFNGNAMNVSPLQNQPVIFFVLVPVVDVPTQQPIVDFDKTA